MHCGIARSTAYSGLNGITRRDNLETLSYEYNIWGGLRGVNRSYANGTGTHFFGMELNYDYGFSQNQYNGNIAGERWRSSGDGERRAYGFSYDAANRLTKGDFTQYTSGAWSTSAGVDYSVSNLTYDANGNIKSMTRKGLIGSSSNYVDKLIYHNLHSEYSNQLEEVIDDGGTSVDLGDFKDNHTGVDYAYNDNGSMQSDQNKGIGSITYNHLNLPELVNVTNKGSIRFVYDAAGNKLQNCMPGN